MPFASKFALLAATVLVACEPVPSSAFEWEGIELPAGLARDAGPVAERADASRSRPQAIELEAPASLPLFDNHEPILPPPSPPYECRLPIAEVAASPGCATEAGYPNCRWKLPRSRSVGGIYSMWRNTIEERWWGRPGLVGVLLATAREFHRLHPEQPLHIGDLDAPGPRHSTHDRGVDVDVYLPGAMVTENDRERIFPWNYWDVPARQVERLRWRVEELARILATCADGQLRIYYNDPVVEQRFLSWFREQGLVSPFGAPMQPHNELHQFHFHVTIADETAPPPQLVELSPPP